MNYYDFSLTTLMVVNGSGGGLPAAFLFSSKVDTETFETFFTLIMPIIGDSRPEFFMSDDYPAFFNGFVRSIPSSCTPPKKLLCSWHVDRAWCQNISKIEDEENQKKVLDTIRAIRDQSPGERAESDIAALMRELEDDGYSAFQKYFEK